MFLLFDIYRLPITALIVVHAVTSLQLNAMAKTVFFLGATGYIGGSILQHLLTPDYSITALVRNVEKAKKLDAFGVKTIIGNLDDWDKIQQASADAEIVIHTVRALGI